MSDKKLLDRVVQGDGKAFTALYDKFQTQVFKTAFGYFHNNFDAEEIVQEVFIEVHHSAGRFNHNSNLSTWIYRITVNKSLDRLRFQKSAKRFSFFSAIFFDNDSTFRENIPDASDHGIDADRKETEKIIRQAMDTLPETQRTAFVLTQVEDLSGKEAAEIMNTTSKAVESLIQRAKSNLRRELSKIYDNRRK